MQKTDFIWQNGNLVPWDEAKIHVLTHALHYGGAAFEGVRFYKTDSGTIIFRLEEHVDRLFYSVGTLKMPFNYTKEQIKEAIVGIVQKNHLEEGYIRPLVFYGYGKMGVNPVGSPVECIIASWPWGNYLELEAMDVRISSYIRVHRNSSVVDAKLCGNYINSILASLELRGSLYQGALLLDSEGFVSEGIAENFFLVQNGELHTPRLGTILPGITRYTIMELAETLNIKVVERDIRPEEVYMATEAFFVGTAAEVMPIRSLNDSVFGDGRPGPISSLLKSTFADVVRGRRADFSKYLTPVHPTPIPA